MTTAQYQQAAETFREFREWSISTRFLRGHDVDWADLQWMSRRIRARRKAALATTLHTLDTALQNVRKATARLAGQLMDARGAMSALGQAMSNLKLRGNTGHGRG